MKRLTMFSFAFFCFLLLFCLSPPVQAAQQNDPFEQLFGYRAFLAGPGDFPFYFERHWTRILQTEQDTPCLQRSASCLPLSDATHWVYLANSAPAMDELRLLRTINAFFNKFPYASDKVTYGVVGYWPTLAEFFSRRSGDCKAYTLSKYFALRALGVHDAQLRIVLGYKVKGREYHSLLMVNTTKGIYILDNTTRPIDLILPHATPPFQFIPLFMFNAKERWTFKQNLAALLSK